MEQVSLDQMKGMLQALNSDGELGGGIRRKLERRLREEVRQFRSAKKKPKGDFIKLLITHRGWNAVEVRKILREPEVCRSHPHPSKLNDCGCVSETSRQLEAGC